jgi:peptide/nickel transport system permease protein
MTGILHFFSGNTQARLGAAIIAISILLSVLAPVLAPYDPTQRVAQGHLPPSAGTSWEQHAQDKMCLANYCKAAVPR